MSQNQLTKIDNEAGSFLQKFGKSLEKYAMRDYDQPTFLKSAMLAIVSNEELVKCLSTEQGKLSIFHALRYASTTGLSLNPQEGKAALIAFAGRVQYQPMKNGLIDLAMESKKIETITVDHVCTNDEFRIIKTSDGDKFEFIPSLDERGKVKGFFSAIKFKTGISYVKYMTKQEVEEHRDKYSQYVYYKYDNKEKGIKKGDPIPDAPWNKSFIGMGEKTIIKKLLKSISIDISEDLTRELEQDDFYEVDFTVEPGTSADQVNDKLKEKEEKPKPQENDQQGDLL